MKAILFLALVAVALAVPINFAENHHAIEFGKFVATFNKQYPTEDEQGYRFRVFKSNLDYINKHNSEDHGFTLAVNAFADLTNDEFKARYHGTFNRTLSRGGKHVTKAGVTLPTSVDWRTKGAVTPVKDQGQCGSCWAFSTTGAIEGAWFLKTNRLVPLSEQQLIDCSGPEGNNGCSGGFMDQAFDYILKNRGIDTETGYPYKAQDGRCHYSAASRGATISSFHDIQSGSENDLQSAVALTPTCVAIDTQHQSFQFYSSGVYYEPQCSSSEVDAGMLAVGYGSEGGKDYWLVKSSWATSWGDKGYIKMSRNRNNNCGIATIASYPIV